MEQSRMNDLALLRSAVLAIRNSIKEERRAMIGSINSRPCSEEKETFIKKVDYWVQERINAIKVFRKEWLRIYGFEFLPQCGCESRIPKEEFNYLNQR